MQSASPDIIPCVPFPRAFWIKSLAMNTKPSLLDFCLQMSLACISFACTTSLTHHSASRYAPAAGVPLVDHPQLSAPVGTVLAAGCLAQSQSLPRVAYCQCLTDMRFGRPGPLSPTQDSSAGLSQLQSTLPSPPRPHWDGITSRVSVPSPLPSPSSPRRELENPTVPHRPPAQQPSSPSLLPGGPAIAMILWPFCRGRNWTLEKSLP